MSASGTSSRLAIVRSIIGHEPGGAAVGAPEVAVLPSGVGELDALLPYGGIPRGRLTELSGGRSSGKRALAAAICAQTLWRGERAVWIDATGGGFYPLPSLELGASLERLLVVRLPCLRSGQGARSHAGSRLRSVLKATDMLLAAGSALALIVVDLDGCGEPAVLSQLGRIQRGAESCGAAVLFVTEKRAGGPSLGAFICLHLAARRQVDRGGKLRVSIAKSKLGRMSQQAEVELDEPHGVRLDTTV